ncbi:phosphate ABC transporter permease subunit PstC [Verrucomicrobium sp. BvORR034]|uniref:phosphate ABC transporter permease subunit PstC n=1 Tax=Verrucomicrobium sp. BvORR034 TaxID=1396418 RepID=UPI0006795ED6|nr:phosphate ABC transporter permease subunit PstC [Verrucomicrobium sp. BvORR034]
MNEEKPSPSSDFQGLIKPPSFLGLRVDRQSLIKHFFTGSAAVTILTLFLIMYSLLKEGTGFIPTYQFELKVYRQAGLEFCDFIQKPLTENTALLSKLNRAVNADTATLTQKAQVRRDALFLAKGRVEEKTARLREAVTEAVETANTPPEKLAQARQALNEANAKAVGEEAFPDVYSAEERRQIASDLGTLQPDAAEPPAIIKTLSAEFAEQDRIAKEKYAGFLEAVEAFEEATEPIVELHDGIAELAKSTKEAAVQQHMAEDAKAQLLAAAESAKTPEAKANFQKEADATSLEAIDYKGKIEPIVAKLPEYEAMVPTYVAAIKAAMEKVPQKGETKESTALINEVRKQLPKHLTHAEESPALMKAWQWDKPIPMVQALTAFLFGGDWITNSSWQDFYGVVPLLTGSLLIAVIALVIALPLSVGAAIYTNQFASPREQELIKPFIEFIQAIPSVVLGFIGISVVGDLIKETSNVAWLQWIPGFPVQERLNMFNAGLLLALMAIPTMFSLAEDAIQNVPRAFSEASEALGATKLQTVFRVIFPASLSGVFAAMLLGLGRIIGETMVVLLVAGNRIAIPDFSDGIGTVFQPAHTLTGIIAQELGEVSKGSSHWQALFMVGILLFTISLLINFVSRKVVKRFQLPKI